MSQAQKSKNKQKEWEEIYRSIDSTLPEELVSEKDLSDKISTLKKRISESRAKLEEVVEENNRRERHNT